MRERTPVCPNEVGPSVGWFYQTWGDAISVSSDFISLPADNDTDNSGPKEVGPSQGFGFRVSCFEFRKGCREYKTPLPHWKGCHEFKRCSEDTYTASYITKYSAILSEFVKTKRSTEFRAFCQISHLNFVLFQICKRRSSRFDRQPQNLLTKIELRQNLEIFTSR